MVGLGADLNFSVSPTASSQLTEVTKGIREATGEEINGSREDGYRDNDSPHEGQNKSCQRSETPTRE